MEETREAPRGLLAAWAITLAGLLTVAGLIAMPILAGEPDGARQPDWVRFAGRFHPVVLHLPIGVFALILLQELGAIFFRRGDGRRETGLFPLFFGSASAVLAVLAGFLLYHGDESGAYSGDLIERHLWGGIIFACLAILTYIFKAWSLALHGNPAFYRTLLFLSCGIMAFTSHDGGTITHGSGFLTDHAPEPLRRLLGLPEKKAAPSVARIEDLRAYEDVVAPIFERRCVQCHKEGNSKGRLRMDTYELLVQGGKEGPAIVPGDAAGSNVMIRILLPMDDDEHMPPEGKPQLEEHEIELIRWWLDGGGLPGTTAGEIGLSDGVRAALEKLPGGKPGEAAPAAAEGEEAKTSQTGAEAAADPAFLAAVEELTKQFPGALSYESRESSDLIFTAASLRASLDDDGLARLEPVMGRLVSLDLTATGVTDRSASLLSRATQLRVLRLGETAVTDAALEAVAALPQLESLNLYGTQVSDAGLARLAGRPALQRLYLWRTPVTPEAVAALQEKWPDCEIVTGS